MKTKRNQQKRNETKRNQRNENEIKRNQAQLQVMIIIIDHFILHALEMFLYTKIIPVHILCSYW
jgi:hypothetical protein